MLKKSLFIGTFFLLFIGLNSYSYGKGPKQPKEASTYSVDITGAVSGGSSDGVFWTESSGERRFRAIFFPTSPASLVIWI